MGHIIYFPVYWAGLLTGSKISDNDRKLLSNMWPVHEKLLNFSQWINMLEGQDLMLKMLNEWGAEAATIWAPFATPNEFETIKESLEKWMPSDEQDLLKRLRVAEPLLEIDSAKFEEELLILQQLSTLHGELFANSITHGFSKSEHLAKKSLMSSFICDFYDNRTIFHVDFGMQIDVNMSLNGPRKIRKLDSVKKIKYALSLGGSSKSSTEFLVRGLGSSFLKQIALSDDKTSISCISGMYFIEMKPKRNIDFMEMDFDSLGALERLNKIDELVDIKTIRLKNKFPGTAWLFGIPKDLTENPVEIKEYII